MRSEVIIPAALIIILATLIIILISFKGESKFKNIVDICTLITALAAVGGLIFVGYQISLQREDISLDKRPYLYVYLTPHFNIAQPSGDLHGGGDLVFNNSGKIPASDVKLSLSVGSNEDRDIELKEWFVENYGDFPEVKTVFPNHKYASVYIHPRIDKKTKLFYIAARISYSSTESTRIYWYKFRQLYNVEFENDKITHSVIYTYTDWDRNKPVENEDELPNLEKCDWQKHLNAKKIKEE